MYQFFIAELMPVDAAGYRSLAKLAVAEGFEFLN